MIVCIISPIKIPLYYDRCEDARMQKKGRIVIFTLCSIILTPIYLSIFWSPFM